MAKLREVSEHTLGRSGSMSVEEVQFSQANRFSRRILAIHRAGSFVELTGLGMERLTNSPADWEVGGIRQHAELRWSHVAERQRSRPKEACTLTPQEHAVLRGIARGLTDAQIAEVLRIARRTVCKHVEAIYPKLGVETRTAAAQVYKRWSEG